MRPPKVHAFIANQRVRMDHTSSLMKRARLGRVLKVLPSKMTYLVLISVYNFMDTPALIERVLYSGVIWPSRRLRSHLLGRPKRYTNTQVAVA